MLAIDPSAHISSSANSIWPNLEVDEVINRLFVLGKYPSLIDQGALGLCGEATYYHHILQRDADHVITVARTLFRGGSCKLGDLKIDAGPTLRPANYQAYKNKHADMPPQADWMLLTALCDSSKSGGRNYDGSPEQSKAGSTYKERIDWYKESGLYRNKDIQDFLLTGHVLNQSDKIEIITGINKAVTDNPGHVHISMDITEAMIKTDILDLSKKHTISLEPLLPLDPSHPEGSRLVFDLNNGLTFKYWSWGNNHNWDDYIKPKPPFMTIDAFFTNLDSVVIAPYD